MENGLCKRKNISKDKERESFTKHHMERIRKLKKILNYLPESPQNKAMGAVLITTKERHFDKNGSDTFRYHWNINSKHCMHKTQNYNGYSEGEQIFDQLEHSSHLWEGSKNKIG